MALIKAKVKFEYKKEWEKDNGYGLSAPVTFESDKLPENEKGYKEYRQYVKAEDQNKEWIRKLKKGQEVFLIPNPTGNGYIVNREEEETSEQLFDSMGKEDNKVEKKTEDKTFQYTDTLTSIIMQLETRLAECKTQFTSEDIRSMAISLFIQAAR